MSPRWMDQAVCVGQAGELFFAPDHEYPKAKERRIAQAKVICAGCPVQEPCLAYATANNEEHGIWGGLTAQERGQARVRKKAVVYVHGTRGGAARHRARGEEPCETCRLAENAYMVAYNKAKKAQRRAS